MTGLILDINGRGWKAEVKAAHPEGATANDFQKAWKKGVRQYVVTCGLKKAARIAAARDEVEFAYV